MFLKKLKLLSVTAFLSFIFSQNTGIVNGVIVENCKSRIDKPCYYYGKAFLPF